MNKDSLPNALISSQVTIPRRIDISGFNVFPFFFSEYFYIENPFKRGNVGLKMPSLFILN